MDEWLRGGRGALRTRGVFDRSRVRVVILEPTGDFSVDTTDR